MFGFLLDRHRSYVCVSCVADSELWVLRLGSSTEQKQLRPVVSRITEGAEEEGNVIVVCGVLVEPYPCVSTRMVVMPLKQGVGTYFNLEHHSHLREKSTLACYRQNPCQYHASQSKIGGEDTCGLEVSFRVEGAVVHTRA